MLRMVPTMASDRIRFIRTLGAVQVPGTSSQATQLLTEHGGGGKNGQPACELQIQGNQVWVSRKGTSHWSMIPLSYVVEIAYDSVEDAPEAVAAPVEAVTDSPILQPPVDEVIPPYSKRK
jgi:hypothetical protein